MDAGSQQTEENAWEKITVFGFFFAFEIKDVSGKWDLDSSTELITVTGYCFLEGGQASEGAACKGAFHRWDYLEAGDQWTGLAEGKEKPFTKAVMCLGSSCTLRTAQLEMHDHIALCGEDPFFLFPSSLKGLTHCTSQGRACDIS